MPKHTPKMRFIFTFLVPALVLFAFHLVSRPFAHAESKGLYGDMIDRIAFNSPILVEACELQDLHAVENYFARKNMIKMSIGAESVRYELREGRVEFVVTARHCSLKVPGSRKRSGPPICLVVGTIRAALSIEQDGCKNVRWRSARRVDQPIPDNDRWKDSYVSVYEPSGNFIDGTVPGGIQFVIRRRTPL